MTSTINIEEAETIVSEYGKLLSTIEPSIYGIAISRLPFNKEQIKIAIQTLILAIDKEDEKVKDSLIQAYVYLAQFIDDEKVTIAENGRNILETESLEASNALPNSPNTDDLELANQAVQTINSIKTEMENLMSEIRLVVS
ncbi:MAG: hypothetical protein OQK75_04265 [Gammaproteobacteria bacterium]|nr:hypothetical protein [Gammaproteobacteria bacterium]MCW8986865.1 hypothetical protein [Gammaproteobacteria bacterium]